ncbi:MAG: HEAT repeat domain-containing protein [Planctomycetota bacterium]
MVGPVRRLAPHEFREAILPSLLRALREDDADIVDSAVLAIARSLPAREAPLVLDALTTTLAHRQRSAREAATLAIGVLGSEEGAPVLRELVLDSAEGRRLLGGAEAVPGVIEAYAALALAMIGAEPDVEVLLELLGRGLLDGGRAVRGLPRPDRASEIEVFIAAVLGLGMFRGAPANPLPRLLELFERIDLEPAVRCQVPLAAARLATVPHREAVAERLIRALSSGRTDNHTRRSCAMALGRLGTPRDTAIWRRLLATLERESDKPTRHFALLALGEVAGRAAPGALSPATASLEEPALATPSFGAADDASNRKTLLAVLLREMTDPRNASHRPWAALALGLGASGRFDSEAQVVREKLEEMLTTRSDPSEQGAAAISLGLLQDRRSGEALLACLQRSRNDTLRGHVAIALGLAGCQEAIPSLLALLREGQVAAPLHLEIARALALLGDTQCVDLLLAMLQRSRNLTEAASLTQALGWLGDSRAALPLLRLLEDDHYPGMLRGFAAVGLGLLGQRRAASWNVSLRCNCNYEALPAPLAELLVIL